VRPRAAIAISAAVALAVAGCGATGKHRPARARSTASTPHLAKLASCGATEVARGRLPAWTAPAFVDSSGMQSLIPHAIGAKGDAVAFLFGAPLRAGNPTNPSNKILWIMRKPRDGSPLLVTARPIDSARPLVRASWPPDSSPGEIYPSYVNVPSAGCWRVTVRWAGHVDRLDLSYRA
jgi:hypothetical protein